MELHTEVVLRFDLAAGKGLEPFNVKQLKSVNDKFDFDNQVLASNIDATKI